MTDAFISLCHAVIDGSWAFYGITIPGFTFTYGQALLGWMIINVSLILLGLFGIGRSGSGYRSGSTSKPKISKERKDDEL